jgi:hypothetical protein
MNKIAEINVVHSCEFCKRSFVREKTLLTHICETKNRWLDREKHGNRIGYQSFVQFYKKHTAAKKAKTYEDFIKSPYYIAFVKFANYCIGVNCINVSRYVDWLLRENIKIDNWSTDTNYKKYLIDYLRVEDPLDAIHRSIEFAIEQAEKDRIQAHDILRFGNVNKICYAVTVGKISPWMLYHSNSGSKFLETLNPDHVNMLLDYIEPEKWALKFHREPEVVKQIKEILNAGGY